MAYTLNTPLDGQTPQIRTIVIDPGHGGIDIGCHGVSSYEKNVALGVSLKLADYIRYNWPDVKVILTRSKDVFVDLGERAEIANRAKADLFICIHCNANPNKAAYGTETYVMGLHKTQGNLMVAQRENQSIKYEKDYKTRYEGFDPNSPEAYIMLTMNQSAFLDQSIYLAGKIEEDFAHSKRYSRGVKQAGFLVLWRTTMPALLCETGFLTNANEEKYLNSTKGQVEIASGIFEAIKKYRYHYDKLADTAKTMIPDTLAKWLSSKSSAFATPDTTKILKKAPHIPSVKDTVRLKNKAALRDSHSSLVKHTTHANLLRDSLKSKPKTLAKDSAGRNIFIYYRVQLGLMPLIQANALNTSGIKYNIIREPTAQRNVRITVGNFYDRDAVRIALDSVKHNGFKDAFIVEYHNGRRFKEFYK